MAVAIDSSKAKGAGSSAIQPRSDALYATLNPYRDQNGSIVSWLGTVLPNSAAAEEFIALGKVLAAGKAVNLRCASKLGNKAGEYTLRLSPAKDGVGNRPSNASAILASIKAS